MATAWLFYLPAPGLAALLVVAAALTWRDRRRAWFCLVVAGAFLAYVGVVDTVWATDAPAPAGSTTWRLVHWNVFRDNLSWTSKIERLRELEADIYVLNEVPRQISRGQWALRLGPHFTYAVKGLTVIGCHGQIIDQGYEPGALALVWADCRLWTQDASTTAPTVRVFGIDMPADPLVARDPILARLLEKVEDLQPDLVAGDLNAPRDSTRLRHLPQGYHHAYHQVGHGWPYTWPVPFPMLAIDQCIVGPKIHAQKHQLVSTWSSDHRLQILDFSLALD